MQNEIANIEEIKTPATLNSEDIKKYICPLATEKEVYVFLQICKMFELNPFKREVYLIKYSQTQPATTLVGYETYLKRAERSKNWNGFEATTEGKPEDGSLKAVVKIYRKDWDHPFVHEVYYTEYVQKKSDGTINRFWNEKPRTMIKKVAMSQAFRLSFPDEFGGMPYTKEEYNDIELSETSKMPQISLEMPKSRSEAKTDVGTTIKPKNGNFVEINHTVELNGNEDLQIPIISQSVWDILVATALKNGWEESDIASQVRSLGYKATKQFVPLNAEDYETIEAFFDIKKTDYSKNMKDLDK